MGTRISGARIGGVLAPLLAIGALILSVHSVQADDTDRTDSRNAAILDVLAGNYAEGRSDLSDSEVGALLDVYAVEERTGAPCWAMTAQLIATRDYVPAMHACLGEEDSPAVAVILG